MPAATLQKTAPEQKARMTEQTTYNFSNRVEP
jgi:hypothetical protein